MADPDDVRNLEFGVLICTRGTTTLADCMRAVAKMSPSDGGVIGKCGDARDMGVEMMWHFYHLDRVEFARVADVILGRTPPVPRG